MKKIITFIFATVLSAALLAACSSGNTQGQSTTAAGTVNTTAQQETASTANNTTAIVSTGSDQSNDGQASSTGEKSFTKEELSKYDGKNGNPAYIAVNGVVYDVTNVRQWRNGSHNGYQAGVDLTEAFGTASPHDSSIFNGIPIVGRYAG